MNDDKKQHNQQPPAQPTKDREASAARDTADKAKASDENRTSNKK